MAVFRRLVLVALCSGLLSGIFATAAHQIGTVPVILKAEEYEKAAEHPAGTEAHDHTAVAWEPENGAERTAYTLLADVPLQGRLLVFQYSVRWRSFHQRRVDLRSAV